MEQFVGSFFHDPGECFVMHQSILNWQAATIFDNYYLVYMYIPRYDIEMDKMQAHNYPN